MARQRMSASARRSQLIRVGRKVFAEKGIDGTSVEELALRAGVSKPVVYEHFGGKEGLYEAVIEEDIASLDATIANALQQGRSRIRIERAVMSLLDFAEKNEDGFRILARDGGVMGAMGKATREAADADAANDADDAHANTLLGQSVNRASHILAEAFARNGLDSRLAALYAQGMMGAVAMVAQWWTVEKMAHDLPSEATNSSLPDGADSRSNANTSSGAASAGSDVPSAEINREGAEQGSGAGEKGGAKQGRGAEQASGAEQGEGEVPGGDEASGEEEIVPAALPKDVIAAHVVNLLWNGLAGMEKDPELHEEVEGEEATLGVRLGAGKDADPAQAVREKSRG